jgi:hypothetical protein
MRASSARVVLVATVVSLGSFAHRLGAQESDPVPFVLGESSLSADTVELGDPFDLRFTVEVAPGRVLFIPDSVAGSGFEPLASVEWRIADSPSGRRTLSVRYPLIAFDVGTLAIPELEIFVGSMSESVAAALSAPGEPVGSWDSFASEPALVPSAAMVVVPEHSLAVRSVLVVDEQTSGIRPAPPADVVGSNRAWSVTLAAILFLAVTLGGLAYAATDAITATRRRRSGLEQPTALEATLRALDELLAEGPHRRGEIRAFYTRSSEILRRYVEGLQLRWSPAWTSTELMSDLSRMEPSSEVDGLSEEMSSAERVKFGGARPSAEEAEAHLAAVRTSAEHLARQQGEAAGARLDAPGEESR